MAADVRQDLPATLAFLAICLFEHHADALAHPGKHPNIDRLLACADSDSVLRVQAVAT